MTRDCHGFDWIVVFGILLSVGLVVKCIFAPLFATQDTTVIEIIGISCVVFGMLAIAYGIYKGKTNQVISKESAKE